MPRVQGMDAAKRRRPGGIFSLPTPFPATHGNGRSASASAASGREVNVRLERPHEEKVALLVQDRGPGISKLHQRRIFEKFYRADESISSGIEGSGIGLALCHQIVEKHEGQIRYSRREGGGSCFAIELPVSSES